MQDKNKNLVVTLLLISAPLLSTSKCVIPAWEDDPQFRSRVSANDYLLGRWQAVVVAPRFSYLAMGVTVAWLFGLVTIYRRRFHIQDPLQLWALLYAIPTIAAVAIGTASQWLFVFCPDQFPAVWSSLNVLNAVFYLSSHAALSVTAIRRL